MDVVVAVDLGEEAEEVMAGEETRMEAEGTGLIKTENEDLDSTIFLCTEK